MATGILERAQALAMGPWILGLTLPPTCCVTQGPLLFLSGLQFPHLRNGLALGWWELRGELDRISIFMLLNSTQTPVMFLVCVWGPVGWRGLVLGSQT